MKKYIVLCLVLATILSLGVFPAQATEETIVAPDYSVTNGSHSIDASKPVLGSERIITNCDAAFLYERNTDTLMHAWNADAPMAPASLVKIMTTLVAVEKGNLQDKVTVTKEVLDSVPYDAIKTGFEVDEILSVEDLLYCMMIDSGNDAAALLAHHVYGSQESFVAEMNRFATELGCTGTNFVNVHGMHDDAQYTTARDVAKILDYALENEQFREIFECIFYAVPATNKKGQRNLHTGNFLMNPAELEIYYDYRVDGGRTGVAEDDSRCVAVSASHGDLELISVIMGADSVYNEDGYRVRSYGGYPETRALLDAGFEGFMTSQVLYDGQVLRQFRVANGDCKLSVGTRVTVFTVLPDDVTLDDLDIQYSKDLSDLVAPVEAGEKLSSIRIMYNNLCIAETDVYSMNTVKSIDNSVKIDDGSGDGLGLCGWIGLILGFMILSPVAVILIIRLISVIRHASKQKRSRQYRRSRRRSQ